MIVKKIFFVVLATTVLTHCAFAIAELDIEAGNNNQRGCFERKSKNTIEVQAPPSSSWWTPKKVLAVGAAVTCSVAALAGVVVAATRESGGVGGPTDALPVQGTPAYHLGNHSLNATIPEWRDRIARQTDFSSEQEYATGDSWETRTPHTTLFNETAENQSTGTTSLSRRTTQGTTTISPELLPFKTLLRGARAFSPAQFRDFLDWYGEKKSGARLEIHSPEVAMRVWAENAFEAQAAPRRSRWLGRCSNPVSRFAIEPNGGFRLLSEEDVAQFRGCAFRILDARTSGRYQNIYRNNFLGWHSIQPWPVDRIWREEILPILLSEDPSVVEWRRLHFPATPSPSRAKRSVISFWSWLNNLGVENPIF